MRGKKRFRPPVVTTATADGLKGSLTFLNLRSYRRMDEIGCFRP